MCAKPQQGSKEGTSVSNDALANLLSEDRVFPPSADFAAQANASSDMYDAAAADPSGIAERAAKYKELYQKDIAQQLAVNAEMEKRKLEREQAELRMRRVARAGEGPDQGRRVEAAETGGRARWWRRALTCKSWVGRRS